MFKNLFAPQDLTTGTPWKKILFFTMPMLIGNIAQQFYSTVDTLVVGRFAENGEDCIAAVGSALPIVNMLLVLFIGISAGASVMVAQYYGSKNREGVSYTVGNCIVITAIACVGLIVVTAPILKWALGYLNIPVASDGSNAVFEGCYDYLFISIIGGVGVGYYNILSGIIRGLGDSVSALVYLLVATVLNIGLDILFVASFGMGVAGVAWATVISQVISSALCMIKLARMRDTFDFGWKYFKLRAIYVKTVIKLGLPSGLTQAIFSSAMIVVQSLTNSFGAQFVAANVITMRVDGFAMMPNFSFGTALTTYAGQNVGAGQYDRVTKGAKQGTLMAVGCSAVITGIILLFGKYLMAAFTDNSALVNKSYQLMMILAVGYIAMAVTQSLSGIMRGAGDTMTPMWISLVTSVFFRIPLAYGIAYITSPDGVFSHGWEKCIQISLLATWVIGAVLTFVFYRVGKWKTKAIKQ